MKTLKTILPICIAIALSCNWGSFAFGAGSFDMKQIELTRGQFAIVDDEDYDFLMQWKWYAVKGSNTYYASTITSQKGGAKSERLQMARVILGLQKGDKMVADHIDHNGLNNQRSNLRAATVAQNSSNLTSHQDSTSKYLGVCWLKTRNVWGAFITNKNGKLINLGHFDQEIDAAEAYNEVALKLHGEFANLNDIKYPIGYKKIPRRMPPKSTEYRGVYYVRENRYRATITANGKKHHVGYFKTPKLAAIAYNKKSIELLGDKARLSIIE